MDTQSISKNAVTARPSKMKLQPGQEKLTKSRTDNLSAEALQAQFTPYSPLLAMAMLHHRVIILSDKENVFHNYYKILAKWWDCPDSLL